MGGGTSDFDEPPNPTNETLHEVEENLKKSQEETAKANQEAEDATRKRDEALNQAEAMEAQAAEAEEKAKNALHNLKHGIKPIVWPTAEEVASAKNRSDYREDRLHFAVCGGSGSGKSSLINALRGLRNKDEGHAEVDVVECTAAMQRYPDLRERMPYSRIVWYDIPGAGTIKNTSWQYFNEQGLFIFDFIILVYDSRFTQIDADILTNCKRFKIPAFIVRSKANQHISNMMDQDEDLDYLQARRNFIDKTRRNLQANLTEYNLWKEPDPLPLRIVSNTMLYDFIKDFEERDIERKTGVPLPAAEKKGGKKRTQYIDEPELVNDLLITAYERRFSGGGSISSVIVSSLLRLRQLLPSNS